MAAKKPNPKRYPSKCVQCGKSIRVAAPYDPAIYHPNVFDPLTFNPFKLEGLTEDEQDWLNSLPTTEQVAAKLWREDYDEETDTLEANFSDIFTCKVCLRKKYPKEVLKCSHCGRFFTFTPEDYEYEDAETCHDTPCCRACYDDGACYQ